MNIFPAALSKSLLKKPLDRKSNIFPGNSFLPKLQKSVKSMNQKYDWILALVLLRNTYLRVFSGEC